MGLKRDADSYLGWLIDACHLARADDLPVLLTEAAARMGAVHAEAYVVDYEQTVLVPMSQTADVLRIDGTTAGRCFSAIEVVQEDGPDGTAVIWCPLLDGTERLGVLETRLSEIAKEDVERCRQLAGLMAELVATRSTYGDLIERLRRRRPMTLPAEIQWNLLPPLTHSNRWVVISCILAPSYEVGGDAFDYAVNGTTLHCGIFDAMGHGLEASLLAAVTMAAYRNARRRSLALPETYREIHDAIERAFGPDRFVTGILGELDLESGVLRRINAGHPAMLRISHDGSVSELAVPHRALPFGVGSEPVVLETSLEPGDRLVLYTDGVTDARDDTGAFFGIEGLVDLIKREAASGQPAPEALRRLALAVDAHQKGVFRDDATTMIIEWLGDERDRSVM